MVKFYLCRVCGNLIEKIIDGNSTPSCCNQTMTELKAESTDGALEKHVPVLSENHMETREVCGNDTIALDIQCSNDCVTVQIGEIPHPMEESHFIQFIVLETNLGVYRINLKPGAEPKATFFLQPNEKVKCVYEYCNLHGLYEKCLP